MKKSLFAWLIILLSIAMMSFIGCATDENPMDGGDDDDTLSREDSILQNVDPPVDTNADFNPTNDPDSTEKEQAQDDAETCLDQLISLLESMDSVESVDDFKALEAANVRDCFEASLEIDPMNSLANLGYSVASILALNADPKIVQVLDSLFEFMEGEDNGGAQKTLMGVNYGVLAKAPLFARKLAADPTWPTFLTADYIQNMIDSSIIPVLSNIIAALTRFEAGTADAELVVDEDTVRIDNGEVFLLHGAIHAMRAGFLLMTAYNVDLYKDASNDYSWIDDLVASESQDVRIYTVSGDTLYNINKWDDSEEASIGFSMLKYNYNRSDFLTLRQANHALIIADLQRVPDLIDSALAAIRGEGTGSQQYDLITINDLTTLDEDMLDFYQEMKEAGFSEDLAANFRTPELAVDFIREITSGPYTISEVFSDSTDTVTIDMTINLSAFFADPVLDLRDLLPYFAWADQAEWIKQDEEWRSEWSISSWDDSTHIYVWTCSDDSIVMDIPSGINVVSRPSDWDPACQTEYVLDTVLTWEVSIDSGTFVEPIVFTDADGNELNMEDEEFFPVFRDPTFGGIFPNMTASDDWKDFFMELMGEEEQTVSN